MNLDVIISFVSCLWKNIYEVLDVVGNIAITAIGIYTAYRTFCHKVKLVSIGFSSPRWEGYSFNAVIQNMSLSALSINKIVLVYHKKQVLTLKDFKEPLFLEPFKAAKIDSDKMKEDIVPKAPKDLKNMEMYIICSDGKVMKTKLSRRKHKKFNEHQYERIMPIISTVDGVSVNDLMKYIVYIYFNKELIQKIILDKNGLMSEDINGYNALPSEIMSDIQQIKQTLLNLLGNDGYEISFVDLQEKGGN